MRHFSLLHAASPLKGGFFEHFAHLVAYQGETRPLHDVCQLALMLTGGKCNTLQVRSNTQIVPYRRCICSQDLRVRDAYEAATRSDRFAHIGSFHP